MDDDFRRDDIAATAETQVLNNSGSIEKENSRWSILKSKPVIISCVVISVLLAALVTYKVVFASNEKATLEKLALSFSKRNLDIEEVVKLANENGASDPGKNIESVQGYFNSIIERDKRILKVLEQQEKLIIQDESLAQNLKTPELKKVANIYIDENKKYIGHLRQVFLKIQRTDEKFQSMVEPISNGQLDTGEASNLIKDISRQMEENFTVIKDYDLLKMKNSYLEFTELVKKNYPQVGGKFSDKSVFVDNLNLKADKVEQVKVAFLPDDGVLIDTVKSAEEMINKVYKEAKETKATTYEYDYWYGYYPVDKHYFVMPDNVKTPDFYSQYLREKWANNVADEFTDYIYYNDVVGKYCLTDTGPPTYVSGATSVKVEEKDINYGKVRVVPSQRTSYVSFVDYSLSKTPQGWKITKREVK